jgi:PleD family two-component response regulator
MMSHMSATSAALYWLSSPMEADLVRMVLARAGYLPLGCSDLTEFNLFFDQNKPKVVILDIILPGQNGLELLKSIKADPIRSKTTILLISALAFADVVVQARKAGAADFFVKPLDADLLHQRLMQLGKNSLSVVQ